MQPHGDAAGPTRRGVPGRHRVLRVVAAWLVTAAVVGLLGWLLPGVVVTGAGAALEAAALLGLINALAWPVFAYFALPLAVLTLGAAAIVLNGAAVAFVAYLIPGVEVRDLWTAIVVALVLTLVNAGLTTLLTLDDEDVYYRRVIRKAARRARPEGVSDVPGVLFVQIDGLGMRYCGGLSVTATPRCLPAGWHQAATGSLGGRPDGPPRRAPASAGSCMAAPLTSPLSGGWRRRAARGWCATGSL